MTAPGRDLSPDPGATVTGLFAAAELRVGELVAGRFRVQELIGLGGMGVVYRAHDEQLHVPVALKLLRPELASRPDAFTRFRQELLLARQVSSPHVVRIHDIVAHEGRWLISMDFVAGGSLERLLDERGALSVADATKIGRQLALGLAAAHERNVVHRDLKPANVLVTDALDAYITDFGIARSAGVTGITASGVVVGTPEYLSPEQARADPIDHRSDLYALGLMLYEMLAGKPAFDGGTPAEMLAQRIVRNAPSIARARPDTPAWLVRLVDRLTQLKPARRLQHATDVVRALDERRVPATHAAPRVAAVGVLTAVLALGAFELVRKFERSAEIAPPAALPVTRSPRIAVFPTSSPSDDAPLAAALDALLAETLAATEVPHVDAARVRRALRQLGYDAATARRNRARVAEVLGADAVLEPALVRDGPRWRLEFERRQPPQLATASVRYGSGALTADALQPAVAQGLATVEMAGESPAAAGALSWPQDPAALRAYGEGAAAIAARDDTTARAAFARATAADARFALAWQQQLELVARIDPPALAALAEQARTALRDARGRDAERVRGLIALGAGDPAAAAERLAPLVASAPEDRVAVLALARAQSAAQRSPQAIATLERYAALDPQDPEVWFALGREAVRGGDAQRGVDDYLVRAQVAYTRLGDARGQADVANALGVGYERLGQLDAAREQFERAAAARTAAGDAVGAAASLRNLAWVHAVRGEFDQASAATARARALLAPLDADAAMADLVNDEGLIEEQRGDFRGALARYREALALRQPLGNTRLTAESLNNVGYAYVQVGEFDNARVFLEQARAAYEQLEDAPGRVRVAQSLAQAATHEGRWTDARAVLLASLELAERDQMVEERAVSLTYLAELDRLEGRIGDALDRLDTARELFGQREDSRGLTEIELMRAATLLAAGANDDAAAVLEKLAGAATPNLEQQALLAARSSALAQARGDPAAALALARTALAKAGEAHSLPVALEARLLEARALRARGDFAGARGAVDALRAGLAQFPSRALALELERETLALAGAGEVEDAYAHALAEIARTPDYVGAHALHALVAERLAAAGDAPAAAQAAARAQAARARVLEATPPALRGGNDPRVAPESPADPVPERAQASSEDAK